MGNRVVKWCLLITFNYFNFRSDWTLSQSTIGQIRIITWLLQVLTF
jgi:hypothetical protein